MRVYFLHSRPVLHDDRTCRRHRIFDARHALLGEGYLHRTFRPSPFTFSGEPACAITLSLRKSFPLTGKIDIYDAHAALLGVATRGYQLHDASGHLLARLADAAPFAARLKEALGQAALDLALGNDSAAGGSAPRDFVWLDASGEPIGHLRRLSLPFDPDPPSTLPAQPVASGLARALTRLLPLRARRWLEASPRQGWKLELQQLESLPGEPLLLSFCAMCIELADWRS